MDIKLVHVLIAFGIAFCTGIAAQATQAMKTEAKRLEPLGILAAFCVSLVALFKEAAVLYPVPDTLVHAVSQSHVLRSPLLWLVIAAVFAALTVFLFRRGKGSVPTE